MDMSVSTNWTHASSDSELPVSRSATLQPGVVHFGTGRRFRAGVAPMIDRLRLYGHWDYGIVAVSQTDGPVLAALVESGGKYRLIEQDGDKGRSTTVECIISVLSANRDRAAVIASIADPRISVITVLLSPKELGLANNGQFDRNHPQISRELAGCEDPVTPIGQIVAGLAARRAAGAGGLTVFNCDNTPGSNLAFASLIDAMAVERDVALADWIAMNVRYPAAYGDRLVLETGTADIENVTDVCAESFLHWVIEDDLGSERSALSDIGISLVRDVRPFLIVRERLLDGSLLLLGNLGLLAGHSRLDEVMSNPALVALLDQYLAEAVAILPAVKGFDVARYAEDLKLRFANPALILPLSAFARQGSRKVPRQILPTIIEGMRGGKAANAAACIVAAWLINSMSADNEDAHAEHFWQIADQADNDWPGYVALAADYEPVFGSIGKNAEFQALLTRSVGLIPGLESLVQS